MGVLCPRASGMYFTAGGKRSPWLGSVLSDNEAWLGYLFLDNRPSVILGYFCSIQTYFLPQIKSAATVLDFLIL